MAALQSAGAAAQSCRHAPLHRALSSIQQHLADGRASMPSHSFHGRTGLLLCVTSLQQQAASQKPLYFFFADRLAWSSSSNWPTCMHFDDPSGQYLEGNHQDHEPGTHGACMLTIIMCCMGSNSKIKEAVVCHSRTIPQEPVL